MKRKKYIDMQWYQNSQNEMLKNNLCMDVVLTLGFSILFILKTKM